MNGSIQQSFVDVKLQHKIKKAQTANLVVPSLVYCVYKTYYFHKTQLLTIPSKTTIRLIDAPCLSLYRDTPAKLESSCCCCFCSCCSCYDSNTTTSTEYYKQVNTLLSKMRQHQTATRFWSLCSPACPPPSDTFPI